MITIEAAPMVTARLVAICGSSESDTRTIAWLAKPASDSRKMARFGFGMVTGLGTILSFQSGADGPRYC